MTTKRSLCGIIFITFAVHCIVANAKWLHMHNCAQIDDGPNRPQVRGDQFVGYEGDFVAASSTAGIGLFTRGRDAALYQKWMLGDGQWSDWTILADFTKFSGTPSVLYNQKANIIEVR